MKFWLGVTESVAHGVEEPTLNMVLAVLCKIKVGVVDVAKVLGLEVPIYRVPPAVLKLHWFDVSEPSESESCGAVEVASDNRNEGDVVPIPNVPRLPSNVKKGEVPGTKPEPNCR